MSEFITADDAAMVQPWQAPEVGRHAGSGHNHHPTAKELEEVTATAFDEGFERGLAEGRQAASRELAAKLRTLDSLFATLHSPLQSLDDDVMEILARIVISSAGAIIQKELASSPQQVATIVRGVVDRLPESTDPVRVWLHPQDAAIIREHEALEGLGRSWRVLEDPSLTRGGCKVETSTSALDATIETRLRELRGAMLDHDVLSLQESGD